MTRREIVNNFIRKHNKKHVNYCEILILKNGTPMYAEPSHEKALEIVWGLSKRDLYNMSAEYKKLADMIPTYVSPTHWLCEDTKSVVCWYDRAIFPLYYTDKELNTFIDLIKGGCISYDVDIEVSREKTYSKYAESHPEKLEALYRLKISKENELITKIYNKLHNKSL